MDTVDCLVSEGLFSRPGRDELVDCHRRRRDDPNNYPYYDFAKDLVRTFGRGLSGHAQGDVTEAYEDFFERPGMAFAFAERLVSLVKRRGFVPIAIGGSQEEAVIAFTEKLGIKEAHGTRFVVSEAGVYTGEVERNCAVHSTKHELTEGVIRNHALAVSHCAGFGDSDQDAFLRIVGYPVAVLPNDDLRELAEIEFGSRRWLICDDEAKVVRAVANYLPE
ncbi:MAG: hypothetical protein ABIH90_00280 [Candidatus Aenigmatarchaeota archaeon]